MMNLPTILVLIVVGVAVVSAITYMILHRGKGCCNGDCANCHRKDNE